MELRQVRSFLAVVEEGQFALAARRLFLSPAAVTGHIQRLERELGTPLLVRSPMALTLAGQRFAVHARTLIAAESAAIAAVGDLDRPGVRTLRVGVMGHGSAEITPAVIRSFGRARPQVRTVIIPLTFREHVTALADDRVDVAFVRPAPDDTRIVSDIMSTEPRIVVVSTGNELADAKRATLADVLDLPFVDLPADTPRQFSDFLYFSRARNGELPRRSPDVALTPHDVLSSAAAGRGAGSSLYSFARYYRWPGTTCIPVVDAPPDNSVLAVRAKDPNPDVATFRAVARSIARDLGPALLAPVPTP